MTNAFILNAELDIVSLGHIDHCQISMGFRTNLSPTTCKEKVNHRSFIDSCETWVVLQVAGGFFHLTGASVTVFVS